MLFKLGTQIMNDGLHIYAHHSSSRSDPTWPNGGHFSCKKPDVEHILNHFSDMHVPILFNLGTSTVHDGIHVPLTLFCDLIKDGRLVDWWPFLVVHKYGLAL